MTRRSSSSSSTTTVRAMAARIPKASSKPSAAPSPPPITPGSSSSRSFAPIAASSRPCRLSLPDSTSRSSMPGSTAKTSTVSWPAATATSRYTAPRVFGLTMAEAMALGKPVIATAYSGNLEFMTPENSYLVGYKLVELGKTHAHGLYKKEWLWAGPDIGQAAASMRHVYEHPDEARLLGERGRADVQRTLSLEAIGERMKQRLLQLAGGPARVS
ncbi:MAG: glycosyltransferase [Dehalococcoidia bacterium]|nr:glycosyltransferase [Dehalococcoidia bacterium]